MSEKYDEIVAKHYWAYRPPLHEIILARVLSKNDLFENGLDIGSGTGYSSVALAHYCNQVIGVEPSISMLEKAVPNKKIKYLHGYGTSLPASISEVNIVTFAGSLFYTKSQDLIQELKKVCLDQSTIVVYDFMVLIEEVLEYLGIELKKVSDYDHEINFDDCLDFTKIITSKEQILLSISVSQLAHVLLGDSQIYALFAHKYGIVDPYTQILEKFDSQEQLLSLKVNIYFSKYLLNQPIKDNEN